MTHIVAPTHHELLELKDERRIVAKGQHVLEMKRDALIFDFLDLLDRYERFHEHVTETFAEATHARTRALAREGGIALRTAAWARPSTPEVLVADAEIHGVDVPMLLHRRVETRLDRRGYGVLGSSGALDEVASTHELLLDQLVALAEMDAALKRLLDEIWRTKLRVNAIRFRFRPELDAEIHYVESQLAERDQEERLRQFFFKRHAEDARERRGARGHGIPDRTPSSTERSSDEMASTARVTEPRRHRPAASVGRHRSTS